MGKFDGLAIAADTPSRMTIKHPVSGLPLRTAAGDEAYIEGYSSDSQVAQKYRRKITTERLSMRNRNRITGERAEAEGVEMLAALVTGWALVSLDGQPIDVPFSHENAKELFADNRMAYVREQWDEFTSDRENFAKASSAK